MDPRKPSGLRTSFVPTVEVPEVRQSTMDPLDEMRQRSRETKAGWNAQAQQAEKMAARAAPPPAATPPGAAGSVGAQAGSAGAEAAGQGRPGFVQRAKDFGSKLRGMPGANAAQQVAKSPGLVSRAAGGAAKFAGKIAAPIAFGAGAAQSFNDTEAYKDSFDAPLASNPNMGSETFGNNVLGRTLDKIDQTMMPIAESVANNGLRVMSNVGNAMTGGYAEKLGRNMLPGSGGLIDGDWSSPTAREASQGPSPLRGGAAPPVAPGQPIPAAQGSISVNGVPVAPERMQQLEARGATSGITMGQNQAEDPIASMLRGMGQGGPSAQGAVIQDPNSTNDPFNQLKREIIDAHSGGRVAKGTMAKKLMEVESLRQGRQTADQSNEATMRGQDIAQQQGMDSTKLGAANAMIDREAQQGRTSALRDKVASDMQLAKAELGEKGFERFNKLTDGLFQSTDADGKATNDTMKAERFRSYIMGTDPKDGGGVELFDMPAQQQAAAIQNLRTAFEIQEERNASGGGLGATTQNTFDAPADVGEAALSDVFGRGLSAKDYVYSNLPATDNQVVRTESGQSRLRSDFVKDDADRQRELDKFIKNR